MLMLTNSESKVVYDRLVERLALLKMSNFTNPSKEGDEAERELEYILGKITDQVDVNK